jgi:hypothetical protein
MPTIAELPSATGTSPQDELPISQAGITRAVSVAELLSGTQPALEVPSPCVLGRASLGPGGVESLSVGLGLVVHNASIAADGGDHASFPVVPSFLPTDDAIINSGGIPKQLPIPSLRALFTAGSNVTITTGGVIAATTDPSVTAELQTLTQGIASADSSIAAVNAKIPAGGIAGLNSQGQVTAPVAGDVSLATVLTASTGVARGLQKRALDTVNLLDFGAVAGGADCTAAFNAAFTILPASGGEIFVPAGDYWFGSSLVLAGKPVALRGAGKGQTRLHFQHTGVGLDFAPGTVLNKVILREMSLYAESTAGQTAAAVRITYPSANSFGYVCASIDEIECFGYPNVANGTSPFPQTFLRGIVLINCWSTQVRNVSWFGPPAAPGATSSAVIEVNGSIDTRIQSIQAYYGSTLVLQSGYCEGVYINAPVVVGLDYLMTQTNETQWSGYQVGKAMLLGLWVANGEVNTNLGTFVLANVTAGYISGLDITRDLGPNTAQVFFNLTNVSDMHVSGCNFTGGPTGGTPKDIAFSFTSTNNSSGNTIDSCYFEDMATVIQINGANGTVGLTTYGLNLGNVALATAIIDQSSVSAGNYLSFVSPSQGNLAAGIGNTKDHVWSGLGGTTLFQVNNVASAANFLRHQPAVTGNAPTLCFDGADSHVSGAIQTKGGNLTLTASGGTGGSGDLLSLVNTAGATNWIVVQNATASNLSEITTNAGGIGVSPKGALWLSPGAGLFASGLPTTKPATGSGQIWNNGGVLTIA